MFHHYRLLSSGKAFSSFLLFFFSYILPRIIFNQLSMQRIYQGSTGYPHNFFVGYHGFIPQPTKFKVLRGKKRCRTKKKMIASKER
jgi:hypothetical protein